MAPHFGHVKGPESLDLAFSESEESESEEGEEEEESRTFIGSLLLRVDSWPLSEAMVSRIYNRRLGSLGD